MQIQSSLTAVSIVSYTYASADAAYCVEGDATAQKSVCKTTSSLCFYRHEPTGTTHVEMVKTLLDILCRTIVVHEVVTEDISLRTTS